MSGDRLPFSQPKDRVRILSIVGAILIPALIVSACATAIETRSAIPPISKSRVRISFTTAASTYRAGDTVDLKLKSDSNAEISYNICPAFLNLERRIDGAWVSTHSSLGPDEKVPTACTTELRRLLPGGTASGTAHLPQDLASGTYRVTYNAEIDGDRTPIATNAFTVTA